jgi:hypothetical protein
MAKRKNGAVSFRTLLIDAYAPGQHRQRKQRSHPALSAGRIGADMIEK